MKKQVMVVMAVVAVAAAVASIVAVNTLLTAAMDLLPKESPPAVKAQSRVLTAGEAMDLYFRVSSDGNPEVETPDQQLADEAAYAATGQLASRARAQAWCRQRPDGEEHLVICFGVKDPEAADGESHFVVVFHSKEIGGTKKCFYGRIWGDSKFPIEFTPGRDGRGGVVRCKS